MICNSQEIQLLGLLMAIIGGILSSWQFKSEKHAFGNLEGTEMSLYPH